MPFTGDLEQLHIVDIIQLLNTARKSGTLTVSGSRGESSIIFSNGHIVGATHLNRIRIGSVLVRMNAISQQDLSEALAIQRNAENNRKPLITTLIELGKLKREDASRALKKLIEMTLVEIIGWTHGTFTLDTDIIEISPHCNYPLSRMEQEVTLDAQMILMDALRVYDERQRDREAGRPTPQDEELFADVIGPTENTAGPDKSAGITAEDLGLGDIDHLKAKIPGHALVNMIFDPLQLHRLKIKEILSDFSTEDRETLVVFLDKATSGTDTHDSSQRPEGGAKAVILFSDDELIKHSGMTVCKEGGTLVFAISREEELFRVMKQCNAIKLTPVLVFDYSDGKILQEKISALRMQAQEKFPGICTLQIASPEDYAFVFRAFSEGARAVFPKPPRQEKGAVFIAHTITLLESLKAYITAFFGEQKKIGPVFSALTRLRELGLVLRDLVEPSAVTLALLQYTAEICDRAITFVHRPGELAGEKAIGLYAAGEPGPAPATGLKIPLAKPSVFRDVIETGQTFYGESSDDILTNNLYKMIGAPLKPAVLLLPLKSRGRTIAVIYGDFGSKEASPVQLDMLEIMANEAGLVIENSLYRKQVNKFSQK